MSLAWIAQRLQMGTKTHLSHLLYLAKSKWHELMIRTSKESSRTFLRSDPSIVTHPSV